LLQGRQRDGRGQRNGRRLRKRHCRVMPTQSAAVAPAHPDEHECESR
jgi:hypothetical protein